MMQNLRKSGSRKVGKWTIALFLAGSIALPAAAQTTPLIRQGNDYLNRGWIDRAIPTFQRATQQNPQSIEAWLGLAQSYQRVGQDANAWQAYNRAAAIDPQNVTALRAIGTLASYRPEWNVAGIEALTAILNRSPNEAAVRAQRALLYGYQGLFAESIADYEIVLPNNSMPEILLGAAQVYAYSGSYSQSADLFDRYQGVIPTAAIPAYGLALQETGQVEQAIAVLSERLQTSPTPEIRAALAVAYATNQQVDRSLQTLEPLRNRTEDQLPLARALGAIARETNNASLTAEAIDLYRQALGRDANPALMVEAADVMSELPATRPEALQLYGEVARIQSQDLRIQVRQLVLSAQLGQLDRSQFAEGVTALLRSAGNATDRRSIALALIRFDNPDPQLLPVYRSLAAEVDEPFLQFRIAQMLIVQGDYAAARQAIAIYADRNSADPASDLLLADLDRREGNLDASRQRYQAILDRDSTNLAAQRGLAGILVAQGDSAGAIAVYDEILAARPDDAAAQLGRATLAYQTDRLSQAEAESILDRWQSSGEPPELFSLVAALPPDASRLALYDRLLAIDPNAIGVASRRIQVIALQDSDRALAEVNDLIARNPQDSTVYFVQGELAQQLGDLELASQAYTTLLDRQPDNADAIAALGGVRFQQRNYEEATALYQQVLSLRPGDRQVRQILADLSLVQDQPLSAIDQLREIDGTETRIRRIQVDLLRRRGFQPSWERY
ncbi:MAG: tetratricopeptide repeat protein [Leptolyngbyaceae cyanobacterium SM1_3_5]|nr:tetratricopeptide repeat protein [Leptolyngbyaceae cyanobacterium SM1_3_5]